MIKVVFSLCLTVFLLVGMAGGARAAQMHPMTPGPIPGGPVVQVADSAIGGMDEIFHMEPPRLLFLGGGILTGLLLVSPNLGISELFGVALGVIGAEFLYQTYYRSNRWF